jgi:hypothetical protein
MLFSGTKGKKEQSFAKEKKMWIFRISNCDMVFKSIRRNLYLDDKGLTYECAFHCNSTSP